MESHMYNIFPESVGALGFEPIGRDAPYEVIHHDNLESVLGLSGHDGTVLQTISYDPFGNQLSTTGTANNNQLHYTGREQDPDTGLYNYRARIYDPTTGRFCTEDPKAFKAGVNFYSYCLGNPVNCNDPYGFDSWSFGYSINAGVFGFGGGGGPTINVAHDPNKPLWNGWSFSVTATAQGGGVAGQGASIQGNFMHTNATDVNQLNGNSLVTGASYSKGQFVFGGEESFGDNGVTGTNWYAGLGYESPFTTADSAYANGSTTSALIQYSNGGVSLGNTGTSSIWSSQPGNVQQQTITNPGGSNSLDLPSFQQDMLNPSSLNSGTAAAGGFLIYPNMPNTNMMQSVYQK